MVEQARSLDTTGDRIADARGLKAFSAGTFHLVFRVSLRQHCGFCDENQNESPQPLYGLGEIGIIGWLLIKGAKDEAWTSQRPDLGAMMEWNREPSPRSLARVAGLLQLLEAGTSTFGQVIVREKLFVSGNAAATAANVLGHEPLFWTGFAFSLIGVVFHIAWTLALYDLFKPVSRRVSLFAAFVMLVGCAIQAMSCLLCLVPLLVLKGGNSLSGFTVEQVQGLSSIFVRVTAYAYDTYLVFFGLWLVLIGCLILRSSFLPRFIGVLVVISGFGWMFYLVPPLAVRVFIPYIAAASALGEIPLFLWLLTSGVNSERWREQAAS